MRRRTAAERCGPLLAAFALAGCDTLSDWIGWGVSDARPPLASSTPLPAAQPAEPALSQPAPRAPAQTASATAPAQSPPPAAPPNPPQTQPFAFGALVPATPSPVPAALQTPAATTIAAPAAPLSPAEAFALEAGDRVFFAEDEVRLGPRGIAVLERQAAWLRANPDMLVTVVGHADEEVDVQTRPSLARARAENVRQILIGEGVPSHRIAAVGFADRQPFASRTTAAGRALNRRAITVITPR